MPTDRAWRNPGSVTFNESLVWKSQLYFARVRVHGVIAISENAYFGKYLEIGNMYSIEKIKMRFE